MSDERSALDIVLEVAERRAGELLNQASTYESLGQQSIADETMEEHYWPLRNAISELGSASQAPDATTATEPPDYTPCLACWLAQTYGAKGKTHSGIGPQCPKGATQ